MAITNKGYDGPLSDTDFAQLSQHIGSLVPVVCGRDDFAVTVNVGGTLTCDVAAGSAVAPGVLTISDATASVAFDAVVTTGQTRWDAVVLRRNWSTGASTIVVVKGTAAAGAPQLLPSGVDLVLDSGLDQVLALVQITYGSTIPTAVADYRRQASKLFLVPSTAALPPPSLAHYGMTVELSNGDRYKCLTDVGGSPAWVNQAQPSPHLSRIRNTNFTMVSGTNYTIDFNIQESLQGGLTYSGGVVTVPKAGIYQVSANLHYLAGGATTGSGATYLLKNGTVVRGRGVGFGGADFSVPMDASVVCAAGDTLAIRGIQSSGANRTLFSNASGAFTTLDITYLGA